MFDDLPVETTTQNTRIISASGIVESDDTIQPISGMVVLDCRLGTGIDHTHMQLRHGFRRHGHLYC
jgi:hypothetical protein